MYIDLLLIYRISTRGDDVLSPVLSSPDMIPGSVYALIHSAQSVMAFLGPVVHNAVVAGSLRTMGGLVFLLSGPLLVIPIVLLM